EVPDARLPEERWAFPERLGLVLLRLVVLPRLVAVSAEGDRAVDEAGPHDVQVAQSEQPVDVCMGPVALRQERLEASPVSAEDALHDRRARATERDSPAPLH